MPSAPPGRTPATPPTKARATSRWDLARWAGIYPWFIADQYVDITGLADGKYVMVVQQNLTRGVIEADYTNNSVGLRRELR